MRVWREVALIAALVAASAAITVAAGEWLLPAPRPAGSAPVIQAQVDASANALPAPTLEDVIPGSELGDRGLAVIVANGDVTGRFVVGDQWKSLLRDDGSYSIAFGIGSDRLLIAGTLVSRHADVIVSLGGVTFSATDDECSVEFVQFEDAEPYWDVVSGWFVGPRGAGTATCAQVEASRSGEVASISLAFRFDQLWCGNTLQACPDR